MISVIWTYAGLPPSEMESRIVSIFERSLTTSVNNIEHIESQSLNGVAVVKVFLQPTANIDGAISEVIAEAQVGLKQFPPGISPPLVLSSNASSVPIVSSSFQTSPNFWLSPNGVTDNIAVQTPQYRLDSLDALRNIPINSPVAAAPQLLDNLASMKRSAEAAVISHYNVQPVIDIYAGVQGRDLGGVASDIAQITAAAQKELPRGSTLVTGGQIATMRSSFTGLTNGVAHHDPAEAEPTYERSRPPRSG